MIIWSCVSIIEINVFKNSSLTKCSASMKWFFLSSSDKLQWMKALIDTENSLCKIYYASLNTKYFMKNYKLQVVQRLFNCYDINNCYDLHNITVKYARMMFLFLLFHWLTHLGSEASIYLFIKFSKLWCFKKFTF